MGWELSSQFAGACNLKGGIFFFRALLNFDVSQLIRNPLSSKNKKQFPILKKFYFSLYEIFRNISSNICEKMPIYGQIRSLFFAKSGHIWQFFRFFYFRANVSPFAFMCWHSKKYFLLTSFSWACHTCRMHIDVSVVL